MPQLYTASQMFEAYCKASGLDPQHHSSIQNRFRYMAKRGMLGKGTVIDERGTYAFPGIEVYRGAIYTELAALAMDLRAFEPIVEAAERRHPDGINVPGSMKREGGWASRGGLLDAIHGVAQGEHWTLLVELQLPRGDGEGGLVAKFVCDELLTPSVGQSGVNAILDRRPVRTRASIDLFELFSPIIEIVGLPEEIGLSYPHSRTRQT